MFLLNMRVRNPRRIALLIIQVSMIHEHHHLLEIEDVRQGLQVERSGLSKATAPIRVLLCTSLVANTVDGFSFEFRLSG